MPIWTSYIPDAPADVLEKLRQIDPHLGLRFVEFPTTQDARDGHRWWALTWEWPKDDPRHVRIMRNELGNQPWDVLGYLPLDCDVHSAFAYVKNHLLGARTRPDIGHLADRIGEYNRVVTEKLVEEQADKAAELVESNPNPIMDSVLGKTQPKVSMYTGRPRGRPRKDATE